jgi:acetyl-CoA C-acetyltransferase
MMTAVLRALVSRYSLEGQLLGDVSLGAVIKHSRDFNLARESTLSSGLAPETPAFDLQRACGTSLSAAIIIGSKVATGLIDAGIAGGTDTISDVPIVYPDAYRTLLLESARGRTFGARLAPWLRLRPRHFKPILPAVVEPRTGLSMGESMEITAKEWQLSRREQDELALASHQNAAKAYAEGFYDDLVVEFQGVKRDNNVRSDTSLEQLAKLRPVFDRGPNGTLTAGNSTPLTDGASAVLLCSEDWAKARGLPASAYLTYSREAAVDFVHKEGLLMAPAYAVSAMLADANLALQDFDFYEIHEAFAAQTLATLKAWESEEFCRERLGRDRALGAIDRSKLNVKGGSVAIGHPFAATGTRILGTLAKLLRERGRGRGLISVCTAGGMGVTAILEAA